MTNLSDLGVPGTGFGILHPILKYRFRVSFLDGKKQPLPYSAWLTQQAVSISSFIQTADVGEAEVETIFVKIEEDITGYAATSIQKLLKEIDFTLRMETLNGQEGVIKTVDLEKAWLQAVFHSEVDYGATTHSVDRTILKLEIPELMGSAINAMREKSPEAEMIFQLLAKSELSLRGDPEYHQAPESTVLPVLAISYNSGNVKVAIFGSTLS
jgi:hypothetical protein